MHLTPTVNEKFGDLDQPDLMSAARRIQVLVGLGGQLPIRTSVAQCRGAWLGHWLGRRVLRVRMRHDGDQRAR